MIHFAMTLRFFGGKKIIDILRGECTAGLKQHGHLSYDPSKVGILLPGNSTIRSYLDYSNPYAGIKKSTVTYDGSTEWSCLNVDHVNRLCEM